MESTEAATPVHEYASRAQRYGCERARLERLSLQLSLSRLAATLVAAAVIWVVTETDLLAAGWLVMPFLVFVALVLLHRRVENDLTRARRRTLFYRRGLDRLQDRWVGNGRPGLEHADPDHPYADDLDLFGRGSLYELLCQARSVIGERTLAAWLLEPAAVHEVVQRQRAVAELRPRLDLRERLALLGEDDRIVADTGRLERWLAAAACPREVKNASVPFSPLPKHWSTRILTHLIR